MVAALNGIIFHQVYGDNSGGMVVDIDGDGTATQEDEFVSVQNTTASPIDISGWQIWSDASGFGAPDPQQDGLFHTFPPGTVIAPGKILYIVNEISGTPDTNMQEASQGGIESGAGGLNTNFLTEGNTGGGSEAVALVDPASGQYIVLSFEAGSASSFEALPGFPGTLKIAESNAATDSGVEDMNAGSSYQFDSLSGGYVYQAVVVTCFAAGTTIAVPGGLMAVEDIKAGDHVMTLDRGPQKVRMVMRRKLDFTNGDDPRHKPILFEKDAIALGHPDQPLRVSHQHRMLMVDRHGREVLVPARDLVGKVGVRVMRGCRQICYVHLVLKEHELVLANGCWSESFFPGRYVIAQAGPRIRQGLARFFPQIRSAQPPTPVRPLERRFGKAV